MTKTVVGLFDTRPEAEQAVAALTAQGVSNADISIVANNKNDGTLDNVETTHGDGAATGAATGAIGGGVLGGTIGLLVGIGALAIPGIGPIIAAGPIAAALGAAGPTALVGAGIGAVSGGLLGVLVGAGIPEEDANYYAEGVRRGGTLVMAHIDDAMVGSAHNIMQQYGAIDIDDRGAEWRGTGWDSFDPEGNEWDRSSKVGTAGGTVAGAASGAAIGSVGGPIGTALGGLAGAAVGAATGAAGDAAGREAQDQADTGATDMADHSRSVGSTSTSAVMSDAADARPSVAAGSADATRRRGGRIYGEGSRYDIDDATRSTVIMGAANSGGVPGSSASIGGVGLGGAAVAATALGNTGRDYARGSGDSPAEDWQESSKVGTAGGAAAGAATGAAIGAVGGPVGAVVGGVAGAVTGAATGAAGDAAGEAAADANESDDTMVEREATNDVGGRKGQVKPRE